jgi:hypothetical protein
MIRHMIIDAHLPIFGSAERSNRKRQNQPCAAIRDY